MAKTLPGSTTRRRTRITTERKIADDEFMAAAIGDLDWLKQSLRDRRDTTWDKNGLSALHLAALHGRLDCLTYLIEVWHYDVNLASSTGWRPVHLAISSTTGKRAFQCLLYLLDKGADPSMGLFIFIMQYFDNPITCFDRRVQQSRGSRHNDPNDVQRPPRMSGNDDGITPCHQAASEGHVNCLRLLLEVGASVDSTDYRDHTPLDLAKLWGHKKCARMIANRMWNQDKNSVAREIEQLHRIRLQQIAAEVEEDEEKMAEKQFYGDISFKDWLEKKNLSGQPTGPREREQQRGGIDYVNTDESNTSQSEMKTNSNTGINPKIQESLHRPNSIQSSTSNKDKGMLRFTNPERHTNKHSATTSRGKSSPYFSDSSVGIGWNYTSHEAIYDMIPSADEIVGPKGDAILTPGYINPIPWSKYGNFPEKPYVKILPDEYPRDQYTMMAKSQSKYCDGKCGPHRQKPVKARMTAVDSADSAKQKYEPPKIPDLPDDIIRRMLAKDPTELQRPVVFKSKHIADVNKRKKFLNEAPRSEASLHLGNDPSSVLFNQGLQSVHAFAPITPNNKSTSTSTSCLSTSSGKTTGVIRLDVFTTFKLLANPQRYPAIKGPEYVLG